MPSTRSTLGPGTVIGGYVVEHVLGHGGMADVYLARDLAEHRLVALKVLPADTRNDSRRRDRLQLEARVLQSLRHPHICPVYEFGEDAECMYLAMEYVEGRTLHELAAHERLSPEQVVKVARQLASALEEARLRGVVHRDLKGSNVMMAPSGDVKILDFGVAKFAQTEPRLLQVVDRPTEPGVVFGTAEFMSPEQALGRDVDHRSDLFSLGVLLYELLTGSLPFAGRTRMELFWAIVNLHPAPIADANPAVPAALARVVGRLLEKDARARYQTAAELLADLEALVAAPRRTRREHRAVHLQWFRRLAGSALGIVIALAMTPGLLALSNFADDAIERNTILPAGVWAGTDAIHDLSSVIYPAINPTTAWISNSGGVVYATRQSRGRGALWVTVPGDREPRLVARNADRAAVGPGGQHIYFVRRGPQAGLYRTTMAGGDVTRLVDGAADYPVVSPDGRTVAFVRRRAGAYTLWAVPALGGAAYRLSGLATLAPPMVSPDFKQVAIPRRDGVLVCDLARCANPVLLPVTTLVAWTPDGSGLAHTGAPGSANIWVTRVRDGAMQQFTRFTDQMVTSISWSPDGRRVAVTRQRTLSDLPWLTRFRAFR